MKTVFTNRGKTIFGGPKFFTRSGTLRGTLTVAKPLVTGWSFDYVNNNHTQKCDKQWFFSKSVKFEGVFLGLFFFLVNALVISWSEV